MGFEYLMFEYPTLRDFGEIYSSFTQDLPTSVEGFTVIDNFLFRNNHLCIPNTSLLDHFIWEMHAGGATENLGRDKTFL